jgi:tetratricopeptide (TPR) repeat protein
MKHRLAILFALMFISGTAFGSVIDPGVLFAEANQKYLAADYEGALAAYQALASDYSSPALAFNLGNAYAAVGDAGRSVLWFERALKLEPGNDDAIFNLQVIRDRVARLGAAEVVADNPQIFRGVDEFLAQVPLNLAEPIFLVVYGVFAVLLVLIAALKRRPRRLKSAVAISLVLVILSGSLYWSKVAWWESDSRAVVLNEVTAAREGPDDNLKVLFEVPEGWVVEVIESRQGWQRVKLPNGLSGWLPEQNLADI